MPRGDMIVLRRDTLANWAAAEVSGPALAAGERGHITDLNVDVVGDGAKKVAQLTPVGSGTYASLAEQRPGLSPMVGCLGDSLMINNDVAGTQRNDSPLHLATVLSGGRIRYAYMGGVGGQNSSQILARVNDFVATGARTILVLMGANDGGGAGFPGFRANLDATINGIIARGGTPVLVTSPPRGTAGSPPTVQVRLSINAYNHYVRGLAQKLGVPLVEWWSIYADTTTEAFAAGMTSDGVHPTNNAATTAAAQAIVDALSPLLPPARPPLITSNTDASNLQPNGLLLNSSGGVATGYGAMSDGGTTPSIVAKAVGNAQRFTIAGNTNAWLMNNGTPAAITVVPGHTYRATALLSWSGGCIPRMQIDTGTGGGITSYAVWKPMNAAAVAAATDCAVVFDFVPPAGVTQVAYEWVLPSTGLTGWCEISRIGLVDLTAQGIEF